MSSYLSKRVKKLENQAEDILEVPGFVEAVAVLTKRWNPKDLPIATHDGSKSWHSSIYEENDQALQQRWPTARKKIREAEAVGDLKKYNELTKAFNDSLPLNAFRLDVERLMKEFDIEKKWFDGVKGYVLSGDPRLLVSRLTVRIHEEVNLESGEVKELGLILTKDTTLDDIKAIWKDVKHFQSMLPGRSKVKNVAPRNRKRDTEIYNLDKDGVPHVEIGKKYGLSYDQVGTILRNYRDRTGKR